MIFDHTPCELGEGPLWHPERGALFWFDILAGHLHGEGRVRSFGEPASAAGWIDRARLLVATSTRLLVLDLETGAERALAPLEADDPSTRSNDGRADRQGGFWIGTMGRRAQAGAGAIYRYHRGELRRLYPGITIPNAIAFTPDGRAAHFTDTPTRRVMKVALDAQGWPSGEPETFLDLAAEELNPDGAVIDADGVLWIAQWGASRVAAYAPDGSFLRAIAFDAPHTSCPAFGGADLGDLYCTTARENLDAAGLAAHPDSGKTFVAHGIGRGLPEPRVILPEESA